MSLTSTTIVLCPVENPGKMGLLMFAVLAHRNLV
jgi:hypothetical protein